MRLKTFLQLGSTQANAVTAIRLWIATGVVMGTAFLIAVIKEKELLVDTIAWAWLIALGALSGINMGQFLAKRKTQWPRNGEGETELRTTVTQGAEGQPGKTVIEVQPATRPSAEVRASTEPDLFTDDERGD